MDGRAREGAKQSQVKPSHASPRMFQETKHIILLDRIKVTQMIKWYLLLSADDIKAAGGAIVAIVIYVMVKRDKSKRKLTFYHTLENV